MKVRTAILGLLLLLLVPWVPASAAPPRPSGRTPLEHDPLVDCLEAVPVALSARGITDPDERVRLDVLVLLDGLTRARGVKVMTKAAEAFAPLRINLRSTFRMVNFPSDGEEVTPGSRGPTPTGEVGKMFDYLIRKVGGVRPKGSDLVYLLTNKDLYLEENGGRSYNVAGTAYCIGGVRFRDAAFAIGEGLSPWENTLNDRTFSAKNAAHEIGHVMGAHHHYGNCVEGDRSTEGGGEPSMCTIMWPSYVRLMALNFGTLESSVIRGYAVKFATP